MHFLSRLILIVLQMLMLLHDSKSQIILNDDSVKTAISVEKTDSNTVKKYLSIIDSLDSDNNGAKETIARWIVLNSTKNAFQKIRCEAYNILGTVYAELNEYPKAITYYDTAKTIAKKNGFSSIEANAEFALSKIYIYHLTAQDALLAIDNAIQLCTLANDKKLLSKSLFQKSFIIQYDYSKRNIDTGYDKIFRLKEASIEISKSINDTNAILRGYIGLAETYADNGEFEKALTYLKKADDFKIAGVKGKSIIGYYFMTGKTYLLKGINQKSVADMKQSIPFFEKSLNYAILYDNLDWKSNNSGWLSSAFYKIGDYKTAFDYLKKKNAYEDTISNLENSKAVNELKRKYDFRVKENEILQLKNINEKKSVLNKILTGSAIALILFGLLVFRNVNTRQKLQTAKIAELEKDKQLQTIDAMLKGQEEERSRLAKDLHDGLGGMLSGVKLSFVNMKENLVMDAESVISFENSILQLDNTIAELRKVAHNLMPEALVKFGLKNAILDFCNAMQLASKIKIIFEQLGIERQLSNTADLYIYRIIQELINNAVKHSGANQILVQITKTTNKVLLTVEDDGKGYNKELLLSSKGIGMKNIQQRVNYFKGNMDIASQPGQGTSVNIELMA